jgi:hypothetical protein
MTDRELLVAAAKAAGIGSYKVDYANGLDTKTGFWNPLTDDGDAFQLAVKLRIAIEWWKQGVSTKAPQKNKLNGVFKSFNNDPYAATRRAITRAAAELGEETK